MKKISNRLGREEWLERSLNILAEEGETKLTIDNLVKAIGVTKGSFYWHFKSRSDFIASLVKYWSDRYTTSISEELNATQDPKKQLLQLMYMLTEGGHARYDVAILNWGQHEPAVQRKIQKVFDFRIDYIRSIFQSIGFEGDELEMRVHTMVFFQTMECSKYTHLPKKERLRHVKLRHRMLTTA